MKRLPIYTRSLQFQLFYPIILAVLILSLFGIFSNIYSITIMRSQVIASTKNALFPVTKQLDERFLNVDLSIKQLINSQNIYDLFAQPGSFTFESGKLNIQKDMNVMEQYFDSQFQFFAWLPAQGSFFRSLGLKDDYFVRHAQELAVKEILSGETTGTGTWSILQTGGKSYFWIAYRFESICLGAVASCEEFLIDINEAKPDDGGFTSFLTHDGLLLVPPVLNNRTSIYKYADEYEKTEIIIRQPFAFGDFTLAKFIPTSSIYRNLQIIIGISVCLFIVSLIAIVLSLKSQRKTVIKPINFVIFGMDKFSRGELINPLYTEHTSTEMEALFNAFNQMLCHASL